MFPVISVLAKLIENMSSMLLININKLINLWRVVFGALAVFVGATLPMSSPLSCSH